VFERYKPACVIHFAAGRAGSRIIKMCGSIENTVTVPNLDQNNVCGDWLQVLTTADADGADAKPPFVSGNSDDPSRQYYLTFLPAVFVSGILFEQPRACLRPIFELNRC